MVKKFIEIFITVLIVLLIHEQPSINLSDFWYSNFIRLKEKFYSLTIIYIYIYI